MTNTKRDPAEINRLVATILVDVREERARVLAAFDDLITALLSADRADELGQGPERDHYCKSMLDLMHDLLGDCGEAERLCAMLGYEEPEPEL